jgi:osmotically-inducible protein OsmY
MRNLSRGAFPVATGLGSTVLGSTVLLALSLTAACGGRVAGDAIDDTTITTRVKTAVLNDPQVGALRIDVDTVKGAVTLSGRVETQAEHDQALALARGVSGVAAVKDALQVIPAARP